MKKAIIFILIELPCGLLYIPIGLVAIALGISADIIVATTPSDMSALVIHFGKTMTSADATILSVKLILLAVGCTIICVTAKRLADLSWRYRHTGKE